ncbi:glycoside hydrolase family 3 N-terminal domain-containing protein [Symbioplanes lichenis]|uniref:glycoside hydrolase family 3 N-terminal domain-containing protein n=1 Tax=Symbioplanes lichenis TaxID=1629072 RepID=UPI0027394280|nr:glycoside hydrolase family 3 N-terminal domain-containing protein [Actinoplanes lichenis]
MPVPEQAGQVLMIGTPVAKPRTITGDLARLHLGGVFLAGRSTRSATALRADISAVTRAGGTIPPLVALDQEGGSVQTLKGDDFPVLPSAQRLGARSAAELRDTVSGSARRLAAIGITLNLAPVADTVPADIAEANPPIGAFRRQYGSDPARVAAAIRTAVPASQDAGVLTVLKHFPGLGRVRANTDVTADVIDGRTSADDPYLEPFRAGIAAGSAAVMMSSARYPRLDQQTIAAYSEPIITGLLREKLGFQGLVVSDDLGAADAAAIAPVGERAVRFIAAGGDLALTIRPGDAEPMASALVAEAAQDNDFAVRLKDAAGHVLRAKDRAGLLTCG